MDAHRILTAITCTLLSAILAFGLPSTTVNGTASAQELVTATGSDPGGMPGASDAAPATTLAPADTPALSETSTLSSSSTPMPPETSAPTSAPAPPVINVSAPTHCRTGPGLRHDLVYTMLPGTMAAVVGRDLSRGYWLINVPGSPGRVCWLWGYYAHVSGDTSSLPPGATSIASGYSYTLSEPKHLSATCSAEPYADDGDNEENDIDDASTWTVHLSWTNTEPNQQGVRVYRNNRRIATLNPGIRSYTDYFIHYDYYHGARYGVQSFNGNSVSAIVWLSMNSCR